MRESRPTFLRNASGQPCVVVLEACGCAEQERGTERLNHFLGITKDKPDHPLSGIDRYRQTLNPGPDCVVLVTQKETKSLLPITALIIDPGLYRKGVREFKDARELARGKTYRGLFLNLKKKDTIASRPPWKYPTAAAGWCDSDLGILTTKAEEAEFLRALHAELLAPITPETPGRVALWLTGCSNPFARQGLAIGIIDRINSTDLATMREAHQSQADIYHAAQATGIPSLIPATDYYALLPGGVLKSRVSGGSIQTTHPVMFFLNPREQTKYNAGWFTVEELRAWHDTKSGPVMK